MTATERLRELLDERGVEWIPVAWNPKRETFYHAANGVGFCADEYTDGVKIYTDATITPEQAIAATLGTGTCRITRQFTCSECGHQYPTRNYEPYETCDGRTEYASLGYDMLDCEKPNYCPNCGRKVVDA